VLRCQGARQALQGPSREREQGWRGGLTWDWSLPVREKQRGIQL